MRQRLRTRSFCTAQSAGNCTFLLVVLLILIAVVVGCAESYGIKAEPENTRFVVFFSNDNLNTDPTDCTAVFPLLRTVPKTRAIAAVVLNSLFKGPTADEQREGYRSFFSAMTTDLLKGIRVSSGTAYVDLQDLRAILSSATSSCGAAEFQSQINRTLRQFPSIQRVRFAIEGEPRTFYDWMNEPCSRDNDYCDPKPFLENR